MSLNSRQLNEDGYAICTVCRKKFFVKDLKLCSYCDCFVCKTCATKKDASIVCKKCTK